MEVFLVLLGVAYLLVLPVLTLIAWSRGSRNNDLVAGLRQALHDSEARVASMSARLDSMETRLQALAELRDAPVSPPSLDVIAPKAAEAVMAPAAVPEPDLPPSPAIEFPPPELAIPPLAPLIATPPPVIELVIEPAIAESIFTAALKVAVPPPPPSSPYAPAVEAADYTAESTPDYRSVVEPEIQAQTQADVREESPPLPEAMEPSLIERGFAAAREWLFGGNTFVRMGMLLVFLGLAFLLRYASDRIVIPLEVRYLGVALSALVGLVLGWRLRLKRPAYALLMQGGAVAVMYLTVFAALKLHGQPLLSTEAGFLLLVAIVALSGVLAVTQDALSLAVAGALGGFAAPVLVSTGGGNHVALFTYFALLNAGILGIAWFKAWRPLNLIGFFGTFLIGMAWGLRSYDPALHFANTEPFLVLFFLMFVAIGLLFARRMLLDDPDVPGSRDSAAWAAWFARHGHTAQRYVDGTLLFGTPLVGFGLQVGLIRHIDYGTAFSSLALGLFYLVLARLTHGGNPLRYRLLTEIFLALGMIFASLAIPLGLDAQWTSAAWAVEAAGIYWIGHRQGRPLARAFALLLQAGATVAFLRGVSPGSETLLNGSALGALMLGLSFLSNMLVLRRYGQEQDRAEGFNGQFGLLFGSLGLWSLYAMAPMLKLADGTAFLWALSASLTLFAALRWRFAGWITHAAVVHVAAFAAYLTTLDQGVENLLAGSTLIAAFLGITLLANAAQLRLRPDEEEDQNDHGSLRVLFSSLGLWSLYLIAPLQLVAEHAAIAWAVAGSVTVFLGLRLQARGWLGNGLVVQLLAGLLFLGLMEPDAASGGVLALAGSGWRGLLIASLIGFAALASLGAAVRQARREDDGALVSRLAWAMLVGLGFIALAVLFVLPWQTATAVWAGCGVLLMGAAMHLGLKPVFWFALALEVVAGVACLLSGTLTQVDVAYATTHVQAGAFAHAGFWTPIVIALAAFAVAWRLHAYGRRAEAGDFEVNSDGLSVTALMWSGVWWVIAWWPEWLRVSEVLPEARHRFVATIATSVLLALPIALNWRWARLVGLCSLILALVALTAGVDYRFQVHPAAADGWLGFGLALVASFGLLRIAGGLLGKSAEKLLHLLNTWVWLGVAALESRHLFLVLSEPGSTWRWLGWVLPLAAWLLWNARKTPPTLWPAAAYPALYRVTATAPLLALLLVWLTMANLFSGGNAAPLPFIPLFNPLDLALVLTLFAGWQWSAQLGGAEEGGWQRLQRPMQMVLLAGAFLTYTCAVLRGAHHLADLPWQLDAMQRSMLVQASLSIAWSLLALGLMVAGHRSIRRTVWIVGAVLIAVVIAKLFFIELSNRGGLERIVSFIGVGVLLLIVGYFAPLPPAKPETAPANP